MFCWECDGGAVGLDVIGLKFVVMKTWNILPLGYIVPAVLCMSFLNDIVIAIAT